MGCDQSGPPGWQIGHGDVRNQRHTAALAQFPFDSFPEQFVSGPPPSSFEFRNGCVFRRIPVITDRQPKDTRALDWIAAQDGRPVQTVILLPVDLQILLQTSIPLRIPQMHLLRVQIEHWINFHELHSIRIIHLQSRRQIPCYVSILGPFHAPVRFVQDQDVQTLQPSQLRLDDLSSARADSAFGGRHPQKFAWIGECRPNQIKIKTPLNIPLTHPNNDAETC